MAFPFLAAAGVATGGFQMIDGLIGKKKAQKAIDSYQRQTLKNPYEDIAISTSGSDLIREEVGRSAASSIGALRAGGVRALMGGVSNVVGQTNRAAMEGRKYLDDQINQKSYAVAQGDFKIQDMMEQRERDDLAGLGQQLETGRQNMFSGMRGIFNGVASGLSAIPGLKGGDNAFGEMRDSFNPDDYKLTYGNL